MTKSRLAILILSILLLAGGVTLHVNPGALDAVSWSFGAAKVEKAWIVRESSQKHSAEQVAVIMGASRIGVKLIDPQDVGPDNKTPAEFVPILKAAEGKELPLLVCKLSNGKYRVQSMPTPIAKVEEAVK